MTDDDDGARRLPLAVALSADLRDLAVDLVAGGYTLTLMAMLERDLRRSVPSALGATITLSRGHDHSPVQIHLVARTLAPDEIRAALRFSLATPLLTSDSTPAPTPGTTFAVTVALYAARAGAFADLATDLTDVLHVDVDQQPPLPDSPISPGTSGLTDLTQVNIALGHLMNRGRTLTQARAELARHATQHRTDLAGAARLLLDANHY